MAPNVHTEKIHKNSITVLKYSFRIMLVKDMFIYNLWSVSVDMDFYPINNHNKK